MHHTVCWSGGKDSTASIILAHEQGEPVDSIIFAEVMFDKENGISGENPQHLEFIMRAKELFEQWGYPVHILHGERDFLSVFFKIIEHPTKHPEHTGLPYGFPLQGMCSVNRDCKLKPILDFLGSIEDDVTQYIGIAADEPNRLKRIHKKPNTISLLEKYGYTKDMATQKCREYDLLSPIYAYSKRNGCWFCPYAKLMEHQVIREHNRAAWEKYVSLEHVKAAHDRWNIYSDRSLHDIDLLLDGQKTFSILSPEKGTPYTFDTMDRNHSFAHN